MRTPEFRVSHKNVSSRMETRIRFQFAPPRDVIERLKQRGFRYSPQIRIWTIQEKVEEYRIRAIIENWPDD